MIRFLVPFCEAGCTKSSLLIREQARKLMHVDARQMNERAQKVRAATYPRTYGMLIRSSCSNQRAPVFCARWCIYGSTVGDSLRGNGTPE